MSKPKISFEQVSLEVVKKILEDQAQEKKNGWPGAQDQEQEVSKDSSEARATNGGIRILPPKITGNQFVIQLDGGSGVSDRDPEKSNGKRQTMSDEELKFPEWQAPLQDLILEFDPKKLVEKIQKVETVIFERQQRLHQGSDGHAERAALSDGLNIVRLIKRDKLGFPDWR
jgi:hypothetical protein